MDPVRASVNGAVRAMIEASEAKPAKSKRRAK